MRTGHLTSYTVNKKVWDELFSFFPAIQHRLDRKEKLGMQTAKWPQKSPNSK
jgi:hypothetical protein